MKKLFVFSLLFLCQLGWADSIRIIRDVDIRVEVQQDGSAWITQCWDAEAGGSGTEFYIPVGNLGPMTVSQLQVSENGQDFESLGDDWDVDRSRSWKTGKCGIIPKKNGVELCWGLGEKGDHLWTARFFVTGLVQAYDDADGFNFQFVNQGMNPAPKHARVTIVPDFECLQWTYDSTRVWAFGYDGYIGVEDGAIVAETSEDMEYDSSMIVLVKFEKGIFEPDIQREGSFQTLLDRAMEGSAYLEEDEDDDDDWFLFPFALLASSGSFLVIWVAIASALGLKWKKSFFGKKKITRWFRDVPLGGNLFAAHYTMAKGKRFEVSAPANNLIGAFFLRWIMNGQVNVQPDPTNAKRVNLSFVAEHVAEDDVEESLYQMARQAAGANLLLEKGEFEKWSTANYKKMTAWPERALARGKSWFQDKGYLVNDTKLTPAGQVEACHLVEFQNFLKDFTLSDERASMEVRLWKEYLVYAQFFGIADKVAKQFQKLYPAQFEEVARGSGMDMTTLFYTMHWTNSLTARAFGNAVSKAGSISGTGGFSSFGGGGGFSGGGFGGGGR